MTTKSKTKMKYNKKYVPLEGVLDVARVPMAQPILCKHNCETNSESLCGLAHRKNGCTSLYSLESALEHLNGKQVRVTLEWIEPLSNKRKTK